MTKKATALDSDNKKIQAEFTSRKEQFKADLAKV